MIKLILFLYLIVVTSYQFISVNTDNPLLRAALKDGLVPKVRIRRGAAIPVNLTKLTDEENEQRLAECGKLKVEVPAIKNSLNRPFSVTFPAASENVTYRWEVHSPWMVALSDGKSDASGPGVVISKRHVLTTIGSLMKFDIGHLFGNYTQQPKRPLSSLMPNSSVASSSTYLQGFVYVCNVSDSCSSKQALVFYPTKIFIPDSSSGNVVLFEFDQDLPVTPICLTEESEWTHNEEVFAYTFNPDLRPRKLLGIYDGKAFTSSFPIDPFLYFMFRKEHERFALAGDNNHRETHGNSIIQQFDYLLPLMPTICEWTGVCPSLPRVELERISKGENEERLRTCGRLKDGEEGSSPWLVVIQRSDGFEFTGIAISRRHILGDWSLFEGLDLEKISGNFKERKIISTSLPITRKSAEVVNFKVSLDGLTVQPTKILIVSGDYVIIEMGDNLQVTPVCLPGRRETMYGDRVTLEASGHRKESHEVKRIINDTIVISTHGSVGNLSEIMVQERQNVFTVVGYRKEGLVLGEEVIYNQLWKDQERICKETGVCPRHMIPIQIGEKVGHLKLSEGENEKRRTSCGSLSVALNSSSHQLSIGRHAPWLVGIKKNSKSTRIHTGVLITSTHVLMDGRLFEGHGDLSELFGDYQSRQTHVMSADIPEGDVPGWESQLKILTKECDDHLCTSGRELELRPNKILVHDSSNMSLFILEFHHSLPGRPICLDETNDFKKDDEVYIQNYSDPTTLYDLHKSLDYSAPGSPTTQVLVKKAGERFVLSGHLDLPANSPAISYTYVFPLRHKICEVTGACPPFLTPSKLMEITKDENENTYRSCGVRNNSVSAPWLVGVYAPESLIHTGVVISRRHVLLDTALFTEDLNGSVVFGGQFENTTFNTLLPLPRADFQVFVKLSICKDSMCSESVEEEWRPRKLMLKSSALLILEFDKDLPVPPICVHEISDLTVEDTVFLQDYTRPESMFEKRRISDVTEDSVAVHGSAGSSDRYSKVLVKNEKGRFTVVGNFKTPSPDAPNQIPFTRVFLFEDEICALIGICSIEKLPEREVLPPRARQESMLDEYLDGNRPFEDPPDGEDYDWREAQKWNGNGGRSIGGFCYYFFVFFFLVFV